MEQCPACGGMRMPFGQMYVGDGTVCHCKTYGAFGTTFVYPNNPSAYGGLTNGEYNKAVEDTARYETVKNLLTEIRDLLQRQEEHRIAQDTARELAEQRATRQAVKK